MGFGVAFTTAPATNAIVSSVPLAKSGVGSAVNDTTREIGGALGIAVLGSLVASAYQSNLADAVRLLPSALADQAKRSVGDAFAVGHQLGLTGHPHEGQRLAAVASQAYTDAMGMALVVAALVAFAAAAMVLRLLAPSRPGARRPVGCARGRRCCGPDPVGSLREPGGAPLPGAVHRPRPVGRLRGGERGATACPRDRRGRRAVRLGARASRSRARPVEHRHLARSGAPVLRGPPAGRLPLGAPRRPLVAEAPEPFDTVLVVDVLHHVPVTERDEFLRAARQLVARGGTLVVKEWERRRNPAHAAAYASDRYLSGDHDVEFETADRWVAILRRLFPRDQLVGGDAGRSPRQQPRARPARRLTGRRRSTATVRRRRRRRARSG